MSTESRTDAFDPAGAVGRQLVQILRQRIIENEMPPGERVSEAEIASRFGVSRQPVREAFIKLSEEGLVEIRPQRGTFVRKISLRAVEDARFIREAIEGDLARILASHPDAGVLDELQRQLAEQERLSQSSSTQEDRTEFLRLDDLFHRTLANAAGRRHLWQILDGVKSQMDRVRYLTTQSLEIGRLVAQHAAVVAAIGAGDAAAAETAMRRHLRTILKDLEVHRARNPDIFDGLEVDLSGMPRVILE